jgi:hypothetical protein
MANPGLIKQYRCTTEIQPHRIVEFGAADFLVTTATSAGTGGIGVSDSMGSNASNRIDVLRSGLADVMYGGTVTRGQPLTNDTQGRAVAATGSDRVVGVAEISGASGDIGLVFLYNSAPGGTLSGVTASAAELNMLDGTVASAGWVIGTETSNVINVGIQLREASGADLASSQAVQAYLSGAADGGTLATAPSGGVAIGTDGLAIETIADRAFVLVSENDGDIDLNITHTGAGSFYLVLVLPSGKLAISPIITFT